MANYATNSTDIQKYHICKCFFIKLCTVHALLREAYAQFSPSPRQKVFRKVCSQRVQECRRFRESSLLTVHSAKSDSCGLKLKQTSFIKSSGTQICHTGLGKGPALWFLGRKYL